MNDFFISRKNDVSFSKYVDICVFGESSNLAVCDVITFTAIGSYNFDCFFRILGSIEMK